MRRVLLAVVGLLAAFAACSKKPPAVPDKPFADVRYDSLAFVTRTTDPKGLKVRYLFNWGDNRVSSTGLFSSGDTAWCCHVFSDTGTFMVKVKARNEQGLESDWSEETPYHASMPPQLDSILGPSRWATGRYCRFSAIVTDPDSGDSVAVKFFWGDGTSSAWSCYVPSGDTVTDSVRYASPGIQVVRVLLKDQGNTLAAPPVRKNVRLSAVSLLWEKSDSGGEYYASVVLGRIDGEPVLYARQETSLDCYKSDGSLQWSAPIWVSGDFAPSLSPNGERLYVTDCIDTLFCFDARNGVLLWRYELTGGIYVWCTPAVGPDGSIYANVSMDNDEQLVKLRDDGGTCSEVWRVAVAGFLSSAPAISQNGTIYVAGVGQSGEHVNLTAVSPDGLVLWQDSASVGMPEEFVHPPVIDGQGRVIIADGWAVHCFNPDGSVAWSTAVGTDFYPGGLCVGFDGQVIFQDFEGRLCCLSREGAWVWWRDIPECATGDNTPCIASDSSIVLYSDDDDVFTCFNRDGSVRWQFWAYDSVFPPARGTHKVRLPGNGRTRKGMHRVSGVKSRALRDEGDLYPSPVIGPDGCIYAAGGCLSVACLAFGNATLANTPWPTYNHDAARSGWAGRQ